MFELPPFATTLLLSASFCKYQLQITQKSTHLSSKLSYLYHQGFVERQLLVYLLISGLLRVQYCDGDSINIVLNFRIL